jgi:DNA-directed RNA polymerase subunit RPC12/RpoP
MAKFEPEQIPWNKGIATIIKRCENCGSFIGKKKEHTCRNVELKGDRFCTICHSQLKNIGWERYSKICGKCGKKIQRENERILRTELIKQFGGRCKKCGYKKYYVCLEFHHLFKEDKKGKHFLKEVQKHPERFELLCNRCHREVEVEINKEYINET